MFSIIIRKVTNMWTYEEGKARRRIPDFWYLGLYRPHTGIVRVIKTWPTKDNI